MKDSAVAVEVSHLSKTFHIPLEASSGIKQKLINVIKGRKGFRVFSPLSDISFKVNKGDFFGIVGRNGSGKSTLLKTLAGIYYPNAGEVFVDGTLVPFIELGVGFNPELTGRENVFLNGALLGFSHVEMESMYDDIVNFAELHDFMEERLKNYSSGMQVRLAFSIAIRAKGDILLLDEVLAVGDEAFQQKCTDVFEKYKAQKKTVILVTHDMASVKKFCNKAILINDGKIIKSGDPAAVADEYSRLNQIEIDEQIQADQINLPVEAPVEVQTVQNLPVVKSYLKVKIFTKDLAPSASFDSGDDMIVNLKWDGLPPEKIESFGINIFKQSGEHITGINSRFAKHQTDWKEKSEISLKFKLELSPGRYRLLVDAFEKEGKIVDSLHNGPNFYIRKKEMRWSGLTELPHAWLEKL